MTHKVTVEVYVKASDEMSAQKKVELAVKYMFDCQAYEIVTVAPVKDEKELSVTFAGNSGQRKVVYEKTDETWIIKDMADDCYVTSCQSDDAPGEECRPGCYSFAMDEDDMMMVGQSEHHYLNEMFLQDMMFDDFKAKSWSDDKDEEDLQKALQKKPVDASELVGLLIDNEMI